MRRITIRFVSCSSALDISSLSNMFFFVNQGNKKFRDIVANHRSDYVRAPKVQKPTVARLIVKAIRTGTNPGRFLKKDGLGHWFDIGDKKAAEVRCTRVL